MMFCLGAWIGQPTDRMDKLRAFAAMLADILTYKEPCELIRELNRQAEARQKPIQSHSGKDEQIPSQYRERSAQG